MTGRAWQRQKGTALCEAAPTRLALRPVHAEVCAVDAHRDSSALGRGGGGRLHIATTVVTARVFEACAEGTCVDYTASCDVVWTERALATRETPWSVELGQNLILIFRWQP